MAVAVTAIMAAVAVPHVCRITEQARESKERANAQRVSSAAVAASAAGVVFTDLDSAVARLTQAGGVLVEGGVYDGARYAVASLSAGEVEAAKRHLRFADGQLTVIP